MSLLTLPGGILIVTRRVIPPPTLQHIAMRRIVASKLSCPRSTPMHSNLRLALFEMVFHAAYQPLPMASITLLG